MLASLQCVYYLTLSLIILSYLKSSSVFALNETYILFDIYSLKAFEFPSSSFFLATWFPKLNEF